MCERVYSKQEIRDLVGSDPRWAQHALVVLFERQTADEQAAETTAHSNGVGFNGTDAEILSSFAKQVMHGRTLSEKQLAIAYKKLPKYAGQLQQIAAEKREHVAQPEPQPAQIAAPAPSRSYLVRPEYRALIRSLAENYVFCQQHPERWDCEHEGLVYAREQMREELNAMNVPDDVIDGDVFGQVELVRGD